MKPTLPTFPALCLLACTSAGAPTPAPNPESPPVPAETPPASNAELLAAIPNGRTPAPGITSGGQPEPDGLRAARDAGVHTVINLRMPDELTYDEQAQVEALGMRYVSIPMKGAEGVTPDNARALDAALTGQGPFLVHCASGNRVGALFGLRAGLLQGKDPDAAVALAKAHGMTDPLEPVLRQKLTTP